jgi:hypothetical protein
MSCALSTASNGALGNMDNKVALVELISVSISNSLLVEQENGREIKLQLDENDELRRVDGIEQLLADMELLETSELLELIERRKTSGETLYELILL